MASICTGKILRGYFLDGIIPPNGIVCETSEELFPKATSSAGAMPWLKPEASISKADIKLAESLRTWGQAREPFVGVYKSPKRLV